MNPLEQVLSAVGLSNSDTAVTNLMESILEAQFDGFAVLNNEPRVLYANKKFCDSFNLSFDEFVGYTIPELVIQNKLVGAPSMEVLASKQSSSFCHHIAGDKYLLITSSPVLNSAGDVFLMVSNVRDVTELNRLKMESTEYKDMCKKLARQNAIYALNHSFAADFTYNSLEMERVKELAVKASEVSSNVLITGDSGTGKSMLAKFIHNNSEYNQGQLVEVNCSSIPESLFESELFGYEPGAFTGALNKGKTGLIEEANKGTLFLDEIGDMPLSIQPKLLHFLQEKTIYKVGGTQKRTVTTRVIAATNTDLGNKISRGEFRSDLFYRLNIIRINVPPLRERAEDVIPLANHFLKKFNTEYGKNCVLTTQCKSVLCDHDWKGNVRELQNSIERAVVFSGGSTIDETFFTNDEPGEPSEINIKTLIPLDEAYSKLEHQLLKMGIARCKSIRQLALLLGVSHPTVSKKLKQHGLSL